MNEYPFTGGEWSRPHFANPDTSCNCGYVFAPGQFGMGAVCEVFFQDGKPKNEEEEPRKVAEANARLIAMAPRMFKLLESAHFYKEDFGRTFMSPSEWNEIEEIINTVLNRVAD